MLASKVEAEGLRAKKRGRPRKGGQGEDETPLQSLQRERRDPGCTASLQNGPMPLLGRGQRGLTYSPAGPVQDRLPIPGVTNCLSPNFSLFVFSLLVFLRNFNPHMTD